MYRRLFSVAILIDRHAAASNLAAIVYPGGFFLVTFAVCWWARTDMPLLLDNQHYFFIAERAASGVPPHVSHFDPKHTLSLLISAAAISLGRSAGVADLVAARLVSIAVAAASVALVWSVTRRLSGDTLAAHLAAIAMMSFHRFLLMGAMGVRPKVFLVVFMLASVYAMTTRRSFVAGLAAGMAFLCWQPALLLVAIGTVALLASEDRLRAVLLFVAGVLLPNMIYEAYFLLHGALGEQIEQSYLFPARFMAAVTPRFSTVALRASWLFSLKNGPSLRSIVPLVYGAAVIVALGACLRRPLHTWHSLAGKPGHIYFSLSALAAPLFLLTNYQGFPDRFFVEPYMAVATGMFVVASTNMLAQPRRASGRAFLLLVGAACALGIMVANTYELRTVRGLHAQYEAAARLAADFIDRGSSVYAVGCTHLLAFNHVNNYSKFGFYFRGVDRYLDDRPARRDTVAVRAGRLPDIVVVSRGKRRMRSQPWLASFYDQVDSRRYGRRVALWQLRPVIPDSRANAAGR